ncbi:MAG: Beta-ribofuranosylaminobenzene 5'-phosphate synthase [Methanosaeta sp. PtaU1.Bin028]|nr:MAG: Beta-ribofuranosylaminobenzene 5'-phosphate synthase [Methanosaeta sp. PtaU1.Bin028]
MSSDFPVARKISGLEAALGRLSPVQKMLLGTDGSVTSLLEVITGDQVGLETLVQEVIPADEAVARDLDIAVGDQVNYRVVKLKNSRTGETLIYAVSHTPLRRLEPSFRDDLMRADIPIGVILKRHQIESRRDIVDASYISADQRMSTLFRIFPKELMLQRSYRIIRGGQPLISIRESFPYNQFQDHRRVVIETPSRIHITLTELSGCSGRVDGGVGLTLDSPNIVVEGEMSRELQVEGDEAERARRAAQLVMDRFGLGGAKISVRSAYRMHIGLGGGTQLAIATGKALCDLYNRQVSITEIASAVSRGGTSGIGTAAFEMGGFIVDGGHTFGPGKQKEDFRPSSVSQNVSPPPVIARHDFPESWKVLLAIPNIAKGAHGQQEMDVFREFCPVPKSDVQELCYQILVRMVPSLVEEDLDSFGQSINRVQELGFKKVEVQLQHPLIRHLMKEMVGAGAACSGLSSFGPAVYAITDSSSRDIESAARQAMGQVGGEVLVTRVRNEGARVRTA